MGILGSMKSESKSTSASDHILSSAHAIMSEKGFSGVGLTELLKVANVPKGSFYHYFASKEAFGTALLARYFEVYLAAMDDIFAKEGQSGAERLMTYWSKWLANQAADDPQRKCLVVKLAAEVSDLSEEMRAILVDGTARVTARLAEAIEAGIADGSLRISDDPAALAAQQYQMWLGASLMAKITRDDTPLQTAMDVTKRQLL